MIYFALFASLAFVSHGVTRHVIANYTTLGVPKLAAYPIDVCVNTDATIVFAPVLAKIATFGKYSCNSLSSNVWEVTLQSYGTDSMCETASAVGDVVTITATADAGGPGAYGSFSCEGDDYYAVTDGCLTTPAATEPGLGSDGGVESCCWLTDPLYSCSSATFAMGVCVNGVQNGTDINVKTECDEDGTYSFVYGGVDTTCLAGQEVASVETAGCMFKERVSFISDVYVRVVGCYQYGDLVTNDTYCPETEMPTDMPTKNPTVMPTKNPTAETAMPSAMPSVMPTKNPTAETAMPSAMPSVMPTKNPTAETAMPSVMPSVMPSKNPTVVVEESSSENAGSMYVVRYVMVMVASVAIYVVQ
eukprot:20515_1